MLGLKVGNWLSDRYGERDLTILDGSFVGLNLTTELKPLVKLSLYFEVSTTIEDWLLMHSTEPPTTEDRYEV